MKSQLGYCYDNNGLVASNKALAEGLSSVTIDAYTKAQTDTLLSGKADKNGNANETFSANSLNLQRDGAATTLYNYSSNGDDYVSFYDRTGGSLNYKFTANQGDNIATERQLTLKANSADVYSKSEVYTKSETYTKGEVNNLIPELPDNIVTDASYVHTDNNFTTTLKNKLDGIASGAEVNVQANWNETNSSSDAYIRNKPTNVSSFTNDAGYLTSESDPTVPSWAKAQNKPTYTASEVGALPDTTTIPSKVSDLTNDLGFVTGSKIYVGECTTAAATVPKVCTVETFPTDANGKPLLGTVISVKFTATNTASSNLELDVNGCGSASVWYNTAVTTSKTYYGYAGRYITYMWDGTNWVWQGWSYDANTTYTNVALGQGYAVQSNTSASATITATLSSYALTANGIVSVKFSYDVPANATLNINSKGAKAIYNKDAAITAGVIKAGDTATFIYNTYYRLIAVDSWQDNTGGGGSGEMNVQSDWNETDTSSDAYILNKPTIPTKTSDLTNDSNFVDATNNSNIINATSVKIFDGVDNYVTITGDYDSELDCNTLKFTDLFSGNEALFSMAPRGYRLNLGDYKNDIGSIPTAVSGVSTIKLLAGFNIFPSRWRTTQAEIRLTFDTPNYKEVVIPEYYVYIPGSTSNIKCTGITFGMGTAEGVNTIYWKDGVAPDIVSEMSASSVPLYYLLKFSQLGTTLLAEYSVFKATT